MLNKQQISSAVDPLENSMNENTTSVSYQYPAFIENLKPCNQNSEIGAIDKTGLIPNIEIKQEENIELDKQQLDSIPHDATMQTKENILGRKIKSEPQIDVENCFAEFNSSLSVEESLRRIYSLQKCLESSLNNEMGL